MNTKPGAHEELTRLIAALLEGPLSEADRTRLEALLEADPQARRLYMQMVDQEIEFACLHVPAGVPDEPGAEIRPWPEAQSTEATQPGSPFQRPLRRRLAAAAAVLLAGTAFALMVSYGPWRRKPVEPPPVVAGALPSETWSEDFEQGVPDGWSGEWVTTKLPQGSRGGITAVLKDHSAGAYHAIQLPEDWNQGLFALGPDSTLHVTYRLGSRTHINVFMHTLPAVPGPLRYEMYQLNGAPFWGRFGTWQTVSLPFAQFVRKVAVEPGGAPQFVGGPPQAGERVTSLAFSSPEPIDFVIDRVWITSTSRANGAPARPATRP